MRGGKDDGKERMDMVATASRSCRSCMITSVCIPNS